MVEVFPFVGSPGPRFSGFRQFHGRIDPLRVDKRYWSFVSVRPYVSIKYTERLADRGIEPSVRNAMEKFLKRSR